MPGGQYTNLREQARALGIDNRWPEVAETYSQVNEMFGNIVKVTPSSKVVGDMALYMVTSGLSRQQVEDPAREIDFPASVVSFFRGDLGQPPGGFPGALQQKVLKGEAPISGRPGASMPEVDLAAARQEAEKAAQRQVSEQELSSWLLYPKVFQDYATHKRIYGDVSVLPTPVFFYGMEEETEIAVDIERGKTLIIRFLAVSESNDEGNRRVFFELNGQPRVVSVAAKHAGVTGRANPRADEANPEHLAAPMPGLVVQVNVSRGDKVAKGDPLLSLEAMKMETVLHAEFDGQVAELHAQAGTQVNTKDLLLVLTPLAGGDST